MSPMLEYRIPRTKWDQVIRTWQILGLTYGQEWKSMTEDIPGSRGHPVTGKVSCGSARMTPSYWPKRRSFEMNPSIVTAIQSTECFTAGWTTAGSILPGALQLPTRAELLLGAVPSPRQREGSHGGCISPHTRQMQRRAAICEKWSQAWLVPLWTVSKLPLWQQRCCREINAPPPRLQEPTTALGEMLPSVQAGLLWLLLETQLLLLHVHIPGKRHPLPVPHAKAPLTNFIPDVCKLDWQLFLFHKGTFTLKKQNGHRDSPCLRLDKDFHVFN